MTESDIWRRFWNGVEHRFSLVAAVVALLLLEMGDVLKPVLLKKIAV